jgi:hypothetical protein
MMKKYSVVMALCIVPLVLLAACAGRQLKRVQETDPELYKRVINREIILLDEAVFGNHKGVLVLTDQERFRLRDFSDTRTHAYEGSWSFDRENELFVLHFPKDERKTTLNIKFEKAPGQNALYTDVPGVSSMSGSLPELLSTASGIAGIREAEEFSAFTEEQADQFRRQWEAVDTESMKSIAEYAAAVDSSNRLLEAHKKEYAKAFQKAAITLLESRVYPWGMNRDSLARIIGLKNSYRQAGIDGDFLETVLGDRLYDVPIVLSDEVKTGSLSVRFGFMDTEEFPLVLVVDTTSRSEEDWKTVYKSISGSFSVISRSSELRSRNLSGAFSNHRISAEIIRAAYARNEETGIFLRHPIANEAEAARLKRSLESMPIERAIMAGLEAASDLQAVMAANIFVYYHRQGMRAVKTMIEQQKAERESRQTF